MKEIYDGLYLGNDKSVDEFLDLHPDGVIIHAAKDPWHRNKLGYTGRGAPKDHPDYLFAETDDELFLNLVDAAKPEFIPEDCFKEALSFFTAHHIICERPILIHCNQGKSRGPGVLFYCLKASSYSTDFETCSVEDMEDWLLTQHDYEAELGMGVAGKLEELWPTL